MWTSQILSLKFKNSVFNFPYGYSSINKKHQNCVHKLEICRIQTGNFQKGHGFLTIPAKDTEIFFYLFKCQFRNMLGESLGSLTMRDLKNLESKVERGISKIRSKKVPTFLHSCFLFFVFVCVVLYCSKLYIYSSLI